MINSKVLLPMGVALLLASCTSEPRPEDDVAATNAQTVSGTASQSSPGSTAPAAAAPELVEHPTEDKPQPIVPEDTGEPRGVLPLKPGVYVMAGSGCAAPANATVRFYDGRGISGSATHACRTQIDSQRGDVYVVEQSCIDTPSGDGPRTSESQTITVHNALSFTMTTPDESTRFGYCPMDQLPEYLRQRLAQDNPENAGD